MQAEVIGALLCRKYAIILIYESAMRKAFKFDCLLDASSQGGINLVRLL